MTAMHVKLDSGSMESLNSMIKTAMAVGNNSNMSLELLSSRVNARKTVTMLSPGVRLKDVKPVADALARSCVLYQGMESEVLRASWRWSPPEPKDLPANCPSRHNPSLQLSLAEKRAAAVHGKLLKALRGCREQSVAADGNGLLLGVQIASAGSKKMFLVAELSGRSCWLVALCERRMDAETAAYVLRSSLELVSALHALGNAMPDSGAREKPAISVAIFRRRVCSRTELDAVDTGAAVVLQVESVCLLESSESGAWEQQSKQPCSF